MTRPSREKRECKAHDDREATVAERKAIERWESEGGRTSGSATGKGTGDKHGARLKKSARNHCGFGADHA